MSDATAPDDRAPDGEATEVAPSSAASSFPEMPAPEDLDRLAVPAHVRRAPRFGRMVGTGVGIGIVAAMVLALVLPNSSGTGRFLVFVLLALGLSLAGALAGGAVATGLDRPGASR